MKILPVWVFADMCIVYLNSISSAVTTSILFSARVQYSRDAGELVQEILLINGWDSVAMTNAIVL